MSQFEIWTVDKHGAAAARQLSSAMETISEIVERWSIALNLSDPEMVMVKAAATEMFRRLEGREPYAKADFTELNAAAMAGDRQVLVRLRALATDAGFDA